MHFRVSSAQRTGAPNRPRTPNRSRPSSGGGERSDAIRASGQGATVARPRARGIRFWWGVAWGLGGSLGVCFPSISYNSYLKKLQFLFPPALEKAWIFEDFGGRRAVRQASTLRGRWPPWSTQVGAASAVRLDTDQAAPLSAVAKGNGHAAAADVKWGVVFCGGGVWKVENPKEVHKMGS